jgi:hypothetical protein
VDIYIDESGDIGLGPRSSPYFVIAALIVNDPLDIKRCFKKIRRNKLKKKFKELPELKFNSSDKVIRRRVLECIASSDIDIWCSVLRKEQLFDHLRETPQIVYNYLTGSLIAKIYLHYRPSHTFNVIVDKSLNGIQRELFDNYVVYKTMEHNIPFTPFPIPPTVIHVDSKTEPCVQAADFVAGAVHRKYRMNEHACYAIIEGNCIQVYDYFQGPQKRM